MQVLVFLSESFILNEIGGIGKNSFPTAAFKEDRSMFSSEFSEGFGLRLWLYNKALINQLLIQSIREIYGKYLELTSFHPYFKTSV